MTSLKLSTEVQGRDAVLSLLPKTTPSSIITRISQSWTHRQSFEARYESNEEDEDALEEAVTGFWSGLAWLDFHDDIHSYFVEICG